MKKTLLTTLYLFFIISVLQAEPVVGHYASKIEYSETLEEVNSDLLKGKVIVLDFWATWCVPCIKSFPLVNNLVDKLNGRSDVVFVAITDERKEDVEQFFLKKKIDLKAVKLIDKDGITFKKFEIDSRPQTFVIDKAGIIRWIGAIEDLSQELLNDLASESLSSSSNHEGQNEKNTVRAGMHFYVHNSKDDANGASLFYDWNAKYWKFNTNGSSLINIVKDIARPKLETDVEFIDTSMSERENFCIRFRLDTSLMTDKRKEYYRNKILINSIEENYLLELLNGCGIKTFVKEEEREVYFLEISDNKKLESYISNEKDNLSLIRVPQRRIYEFNNILLKQIAQKSSDFGIIVRDASNEMQKRYNLNIDASDFETFLKSLGEYGLRLKKGVGMTKVLYVKFVKPQNEHLISSVTNKN